MNVEEQTPSIKQYWEKANIYFNREFPNENPFVNNSSWQGVYPCIFSTNITPILPCYVPENINDAKIILESQSSKLFYCELCAYDNRRYIGVLNNCKISKSKKSFKKENPGYLSQIFEYRNASWTIATPLRKIFDNHVLLY